MRKESSCRSPPKRETADVPLFWLVCHPPASTRTVKGAKHLFYPLLSGGLLVSIKPARINSYRKIRKKRGQNLWN